MRPILAGIWLALLLSSPVFSAERSILVRVTTYWRAEGSGQRAASNGTRLRNIHCAVDPRKIPYGSTVVFPDMECIAVDTGPAVVSRKSARLCGRNATQKDALVIDRFFETKREALAWSNSHPNFITVKIKTRPESPNRGSAPAKSNTAVVKQDRQMISPANPRVSMPTRQVPGESVPLLTDSEANSLRRWAVAARLQ